MQILEIDVGNSSAKWRLLDAKCRPVSRGCISGYAWSELVEQIEVADHIRIASVANKGLEAFIVSSYPNKSIYVARSMQQIDELTNVYEDFANLGVDRWLAIVAAYHQVKRACYVFDCGSAVTLDIVTDHGRHQGGFIVPGLQMLQNSLLNNTAEIDFDPVSMDYDFEHIGLGRNTQQAVVHGSYFLLRAWLQYYLDEAQKKGAVVFFTGGDSVLLMDNLCSTERHFPELVLDGLSILESASLREST